jgi:hypothetical protein
MAAAPYRRTFVRLLGFLKPYKWTLWISVILAVLSQAVQNRTVLGILDDMTRSSSPMLAPSEDV